MRAEINEKGCLKITAETPVESFALRHWSEDYFNQQDSGETGECSLLIETISEGKEDVDASK